ncbi:LysM peptidoglycan-binding domain-containing protein, partial [Actinacidiphila oryziradicis]|uniref:LysM peptidoglycan-binding domain-containing protein n=1 Tax=Actinacidiphila oryziradicis TaxID=2571141 RepID=UPI0023EFF482
ASSDTPAGTHTDGGHADRPIGSGHATEYTVRPGDNLSQIAEDQLGSAAQYPKIFQLNENEAQPGGRHFTDPDLIYPGQHLDLPAAHAAPSESSDPGSGGSDPGAASQHDGGTQHPAATPPATPDTTTSPSATAPSTSASGNATEGTGSTGQPTASPAQSAPAQPGPDATTAPASPAVQPSRDTPATTSPETATPTTAPAASADEGSDDTTQQVVLAAGIGALLAASLAGALGVKRILQQRRRRAGETIAIDPDPTRLEQVLNTTAEPAGVVLLDTVLRTLASHAAAAGRELPVVRGARVTERTVQLLIDDPATELLPPFAAGNAPGTWILDPVCPLLSGDALREVPAPYPGLVTLGADENADLLLVNLLYTGALLLDGGDDDVLAVGRALALEAGTSGWTDHTEIVTIGLGARLATLLPQGRVRTMPHLPSVVADLGALLVEVHQQSSSPDGGPEPLPWILICAGDVAPEQAWQLADAVSAARELPVAVVLPASEATRAAFPDAEQIAVAPDVPVTLPHLGAGPVQLQRLTDEQYRQYVHALEVAEQPAEPATGAWQLAEDHDLAATTPRPGPHPLLLHHGDDAGADPGNPFPALLATASADPSRIRLVKPAAAADGTGDGAAIPGQDTAEPAGAAPAGSGEMPAAGLPQGEGDVGGADPDAPGIDVLGPIQVTGITGSGHGPKVAALAALIYLRPGRTADALCTAMDPVSPWSTRTLQSRLSEIRSRFGAAPDGDPYLPRPRVGYEFHPAVRSDWARFQQLAGRGLAAGPDAGLPDLENALGLVRGKPFDGQDYPWADSSQQEMLSRIVDVAHTLATWHTEGDAPDLDAARQAVLRGLDIDETAEVLYRDWMNIEWAAGNTAGVRKAVSRVQQVTRSYDISMEMITEQTIDLVLSDRPAAAHAGRA